MKTFLKTLFWTTLGTLSLLSLFCIISLMLLSAPKKSLLYHEEQAKQQIKYHIMTQNDAPDTIQNLSFGLVDCGDDFCTADVMWLDLTEPDEFKYSCFVYDGEMIYTVRCEFL